MLLLYNSGTEFINDVLLPSSSLNIYKTKPKTKRVQGCNVTAHKQVSKGPGSLLCTMTSHGNVMTSLVTRYVSRVRMSDVIERESTPRRGTGTKGS